MLIYGTPQNKPSKAPGKWSNCILKKRSQNLQLDIFPLQGDYKTQLKKRVHSEIQISNKIKLEPNIMPFAFFFSKSVSIPSDINSGPKISLPGPALSLPGTCIIASDDLHFLFQDLNFLFRDLHYCLRDLHYHFQDLQYCFRTCTILT